MVPADQPIDSSMLVNQPPPPVLPCLTIRHGVGGQFVGVAEVMPHVDGHDLGPSAGRIW